MGIYCNQEEVRPGERRVQQVKRKGKRILESGGSMCKGPVVGGPE